MTLAAWVGLTLALSGGAEGFVSADVVELSAEMAGGTGLVGGWWVVRRGN